MADEDRVNSYTFDPPAWWLTLVQEKLKPRGARRRALEAVNAIVAKPLDEPGFGRLVSGLRVRIDAAIALSTVLRIAPPIFLPATEAESRAIVAEMSLHARVAPRLESLRGSLSREDSNDHTAAVQPGGGAQRERRGRRVG